MRIKLFYLAVFLAFLLGGLCFVIAGKSEEKRNSEQVNNTLSGKLASHSNDNLLNQPAVGLEDCIANTENILKFVESKTDPVVLELKQVVLSGIANGLVDVNATPDLPVVAANNLQAVLHSTDSDASYDEVLRQLESKSSTELLNSMVGYDSILSVLLLNNPNMDELQLAKLLDTGLVPQQRDLAIATAVIKNPALIELLVQRSAVKPISEFRFAKAQVNFSIFAAATKNYSMVNYWLSQGVPSQNSAKSLDVFAFLEVPGTAAEAKLVSDLVVELVAKGEYPIKFSSVLSLLPLLPEDTRALVIEHAQITGQFAEASKVVESLPVCSTFLPKSVEASPEHTIMPELTSAMSAEPLSAAEAAFVPVFTQSRAYLKDKKWQLYANFMREKLGPVAPNVESYIVSNLVIENAPDEAIARELKLGVLSFESAQQIVWAKRETLLRLLHEQNVRITSKKQHQLVLTGLSPEVANLVRQMQQ